MIANGVPGDVVHVSYFENFRCTIVHVACNLLCGLLVVHVYLLMKLRHVHSQQLANTNHKKDVYRVEFNMSFRKASMSISRNLRVDVSILLGSGGGLLSEHKKTVA